MRPRVLSWVPRRRPFQWHYLSTTREFSAGKADEIRREG
jgi:hypothetical protein